MLYYVHRCNPRSSGTIQTKKQMQTLVTCICSLSRSIRTRSACDGRAARPRIDLLVTPRCRQLLVPFKSSDRILLLVSFVSAVSSAPFVPVSTLRTTCGTLSIGGIITTYGICDVVHTSRRLARASQYSALRAACVAACRLPCSREPSGDCSSSASARRAHASRLMHA